jgi:SAM-dependent methyltransferase
MQKPNPCALCNSFDFRVIYQREMWKYRVCLNCFLVSVHPRPSPDELIEIYQTYLPDQPEEIAGWERMMRAVIVKSANLIETGVRTGKGRLLDVGSGYGFFLKEMKSRGWQVEGIEVSEAGRQYAQEKWGIHVYAESLENIDLPETYFDAVTLFYVIEHVFDPFALLTEVNRILKPDGLILLRWPHTTPIIRILGPLAKKLDLYHTPYHLYDFSPRTINRALLGSGFREVKTCIGGYTRPPQRSGQWASTIFGQLGEALYFLSRGKILFPGVSKTTIAYKIAKIEDHDPQY